jgi:serine/threonine protein kinase
MAPEVMLGGWYGFAVDFWAVGVVLYEMLAGMVRDLDSSMDRLQLTFGPVSSFPSSRETVIHNRMLSPGLSLSSARTSIQRPRICSRRYVSLS